MKMNLKKNLKTKKLRKENFNSIKTYKNLLGYIGMAIWAMALCSSYVATLCKHNKSKLNSKL